jgi:hypothetical protein
MSISIRARVALAAAAVVAVWSTAADAATPKGSAKYYGGHVISHVNVVPVMWGTGAAKDVVAGAEKFYGTVVASPYMDWLGEYDTVGLMGEGDQKPGSNQRIHRGTASPLVTITPSTTSKTVTDAQIQKELLAQIASGALPAPKVDADGGVDTVYMFSFPAGYTVKDFGGQDVCSGACAYHWTVSAPGISAGVPYGVIPDCSASKTNYCALGTVFETYTGDASHELLEAITDPECGLVTTQAASRPLGWFDPAQANEEGEIADSRLVAASRQVHHERSEPHAVRRRRASVSSVHCDRLQRRHVVRRTAYEHDPGSMHHAGRHRWRQRKWR